MIDKKTKIGRKFLFPSSVVTAMQGQSINYLTYSFSILMRGALEFSRKNLLWHLMPGQIAVKNPIWSRICISCVIKLADRLTISEQFSTLIANFHVITEIIFHPDRNFHVIKIKKNPPPDPLKPLSRNSNLIKVLTTLFICQLNYRNLIKVTLQMSPIVYYIDSLEIEIETNNLLIKSGPK